MSVALRTYYRGVNLAGMVDHVAGTSRTYHLDHQGTVQCLTDDNGVVTDRFACDAWGNELKQTGTSINRQWYVGNLGYYRQVDRALHHVGARWLEPARGGWPSRDPRSAPGGSEPAYHYVAGNPVRHVDPSGAFTVNLYSSVVADSVSQATAGARSTKAADIWMNRLTTGITALRVQVVLPRPPAAVCTCVYPSGAGRLKELARVTTVNIRDSKEGEIALAEAVIRRYTEHVHPVRHTPCDGFFTVWTNSAPDLTRESNYTYTETYWPRLSRSGRRWGPTFWWEQHLKARRDNGWILNHASGLLAHEFGHGVFGLHHTPCGLMHGLVGLPSGSLPPRWSDQCLSRQANTVSGLACEGVSIKPGRECERNFTRVPPYLGCAAPGAGGSVGRERPTSAVPSFRILHAGECQLPGEVCCDVPEGSRCP
ncbi:MAG: hypothetical protein FJX77_12665 [Armatimonadetes bacterium]|nr:hypothetical protein [Armatimonadota bacterium]